MIYLVGIKKDQKMIWQLRLPHSTTYSGNLKFLLIVANKFKQKLCAQITHLASMTESSMKKNSSKKMKKTAEIEDVDYQPLPSSLHYL